MDIRPYNSILSCMLSQHKPKGKKWERERISIFHVHHLFHTADTKNTHTQTYTCGVATNNTHHHTSIVCAICFTTFRLRWVKWPSIECYCFCTLCVILNGNVFVDKLFCSAIVSPYETKAQKRNSILNECGCGCVCICLYILYNQLRHRIYRYIYILCKMRNKTLDRR